MLTSRGIEAIACMTLAAGCAGLASFGYTGDGKLTDHGMLAYSARYIVDLGPIDTSSPTTRSYKLSGLPRATFTVGIDVTEPTPNRFDNDRTRHGRVAVTLQNGAGETVIAEDTALQHWVRSYGLGSYLSRFYLAGQLRDVPLPGGGVRNEQIGEKASGGWGTYFKSDPEDSYALSVQIIEPFDEESRNARVSLVGWDR